MSVPSTPQGKQGAKGGLTVLSLRPDDDIALDDDTLQARPRAREARAERERADARRPEALERLRVLAPRAHEHLERGRAVDREPFEQVEHRVALVVDQEREGDDQALWMCGTETR